MNFYRLAVLSVVALSSVVSAEDISPLDPNLVVVQRGDAQVTMRDVDAFMQRVPVERKAGVVDSPKRIDEMLRNMLLKKQLARQALTNKLDADPAVLGKAGWERTEALAALRLDQFINSIQVPDLGPLASEEYQAHKNKYTATATIDVQRISIAMKSSQRDKKASWDLISGVREKAIAHPENFDALVLQYSEEPNKEQSHGFMKDVLRTQKDKVLLDAVNELSQPSQISLAFLSYGNFQILKLIQSTPGQQQSFAESRDFIMGQLKANFIEQARREFIDGLGSQPIDGDPDAIASLRTRYGAVPAVLGENAEGKSGEAAPAVPAH